MRGRIQVPTSPHEDVVSGWGLGCGDHSWSRPCQGLLLSSLLLCVGLPTPGKEGGDQEFPNHPPGGARVRRGTPGQPGSSLLRSTLCFNGNSY